MKQHEDQNTEKDVSYMNGEENENSQPVANTEELEKLQQQVQEMNDKYLRQAAEFENYKRRTAKERVELMQTAGRDVITDLLEVLDDSERAQNQMETSDDVAQIKEGIQLVFTKFRNTLASKGLRPIEAVNKDFDVDLHEAVSEIDAGPEMHGKVVAEVQKGYTLNDKIIRFAKVVVGR